MFPTGLPHAHGTTVPQRPAQHPVQAWCPVRHSDASEHRGHLRQRLQVPSREVCFPAPVRLHRCPEQLSVPHSQCSREHGGGGRPSVCVHPPPPGSAGAQHLHADDDEPPVPSQQHRLPRPHPVSARFTPHREHGCGSQSPGMAGSAGGVAGQPGGDDGRDDGSGSVGAAPADDGRPGPLVPADAASPQTCGSEPHAVSTPYGTGSSAQTPSFSFHGARFSSARLV